MDSMEDRGTAPAAGAAAPVASRCYSSRTMKTSLLEASSLLHVMQDRAQERASSEGEVDVVVADEDAEQSTRKSNYLLFLGGGASTDAHNASGMLESPTSHVELVESASSDMMAASKPSKGTNLSIALQSVADAQPEAPAPQDDVEVPEEVLRDLVKRFMDESSSQWSVNEWTSKIAAELGMSDMVTKAFKKTVKAIVVDELSAQASQLSQGGFSQEYEAAGDVLADPTPPASAAFDINSDAVRDIVFRLFNSESMLWSVKTWLLSVCQELGITEAAPELKTMIKSIVTDAAKDAMTQSQDMDYTLEELNDLLPSDGLPGETEIPLDFVEDEVSDSPTGDRDGRSSDSDDNDGSSDNSSRGAEDSDSFSAMLSSDEEAVGAKESKSKKSKDRKRKNKSSSKRQRAPSSPDGPAVPKMVENLEEKKQAVANEEVQAAKVLEEGLNERALAVFEMTYRDKDEIESKHNELRNRVVNRIRNKVDPAISQAQNIGSLKALRSNLIDNGGKLMEIVKVIADDAALKAAETALAKAEGSDEEEEEDGSVVELSDEDDDLEVVDDEEEVVAKKEVAVPEKKSLDFIAAGALRVGQVKTVHGIRARLKAELKSRALEESCTRLAERVGVSSSAELTAVLGYTEVVRRTHAAQQAEQERLRREQEEKERLEKEERRKKYRERLFAQEDASSDFEFDDVDDDFNKPVAATTTKADSMDLSEESDDNASEDEKDEEEKLAELELREKELEERVQREAEEEAAAAELASREAEVSAANNTEVGTSTQLYGEDDIDGTEEGANIVSKRSRKLVGDDDDNADSSTPLPRGDAVTTQPTQIVDDNLLLDDEEPEKEAESSPSPKKPVDSKPKSKNAKYQEMLLRDMKASKQSSNMFLDVEAEEEEEEGLQRGLLDFGFGKTSDKLDAEDEADALKLRKADLEGIVDEVSDDEGDEEEGRRRRLEEERRHDRKLQLKILKTLAEGHGATRAASKAGTRGHFGLDELTKGDLKKLGKSEEDDEESEGEGEGAAVVEIDDENDLQYIDSFKKRVKETEEARANESDSDLEVGENEDGSDDDIEAEDPESAAIEREERRMRKDREAILTRTWLETTRMKCVMHEEGRKQKLMSGLMSLGSEISGPGATQSQASGMPVHFPKGTGHVLSQSNGEQAQANISRAKSMSALASAPSLPPKPMLARQPSAHLLQELENIGNPQVVPSKEAPVASVNTASSEASNTDTMTTKPTVLSDITNVTANPAFGFADVSVASNAVTHFPAVVKKSLKRSMTASGALSEGNRLTIDTSVTISHAESSNAGTPNGPLTTGTSSGSSTLMGPPTKTPRMSKNAYSGILDDSAGEAALCMGMTLAPDASNADASGDIFSAVLSRSGLASKSGFNAIGSAGRKNSFFPAAASAVSSSGMKRSLSSAAVTVAGQGFVFTSESRMAIPSTNSQSQFGDDYNTSTGFGDDNGQTMGFSNANSNFYSDSNAPSMKRQKSAGSLSSMSNANSSNSLVDAVKRQMNSALNQPQQRDDGRKAVRSILDTINSSGTSSRSTNFKRSATVAK